VKKETKKRICARLVDMFFIGLGAFIGVALGNVLFK